MNVLCVHGAIAEGHLALHRNVEHFKASHQGWRDRLHPWQVVRAATKFVWNVTIIEFLHHLELDMWLIDIGIHEKALGTQAQILDNAVLTTELKFSWGIRAGWDEWDLILIHGVVCWHRRESSLELKPVWLGIWEDPGPTEVEPLAKRDHHVKFHAIQWIWHSHHLKRHYQSWERRRSADGTALCPCEEFLDLFGIRRESTFSHGATKDFVKIISALLSISTGLLLCTLCRLLLLECCGGRGCGSDKEGCENFAAEHI